uniref:Uncharacterized protein n=1 Tax=Gopherus agassizii TaxID=38772 RepID=A0A452H4I9_9SAUR
MAEAQQSRMQEAIDSMVQGLERENIRKMQVTERGGWGELGWVDPLAPPRTPFSVLPAPAAPPFTAPHLPALVPPNSPH